MAPLGIIFDMDGTLVDSVDQHAKAWQEAFAHFGHDIPFAEIRGQIGKGGDQLMPVFLDKEDLARIGKSLETYRERLFKERYLPHLRAFPGVRALFERLVREGRRVALASSAKGDQLEHYKKLARIDDLLDAETSSDDAEESKPHPDIFQAALARLRMDPGQAMVVGDTQYDAEAAAKAGMPTIGVLCGGFPREVLERAGCIAIYRDPEDLLRQFDSSPLAR